MNSFGRSLLIYIGTPMVAGGLWKKADIERKEKGIIKESMMIPQNINPDIVANLVRNTQPAAEVVAKLALRTTLTNQRQKQLPWKGNKTDDKPKRVKLYIPRDIANQIWAQSTNKTEIRYRETNICVKHKTEVNPHHIKECDNFTGVEPLQDIIQKLK